MTPQDVIDQARLWIGTPYHHQGRQLGVGVDCTGLPVCVFGACGHPMQDVNGYPRVPHGSQLRAELAARFVKVQHMQPADILELKQHNSAEATHLAFYTERDTIIHANGSVWNKINKVIEHRYVHPWPSRLRGIWRHPAFIDIGAVDGFEIGSRIGSELFCK